LGAFRETALTEKDAITAKRVLDDNPLRTIASLAAEFHVSPHTLTRVMSNL